MTKENKNNHDMIIKRAWLKCRECKCAWYDDANNSFAGCPECGGEFTIIEEEELNFTNVNTWTKKINHKA